QGRRGRTRGDRPGRRHPGRADEGHRRAPGPARRLQLLGRVSDVPRGYFDAYVFDLDGTIYLGDELLPGAARLVTELRARAIPVRFLSNNPTRDVAGYAERLARFGLPTPADEIVGTVPVLVRWLGEHHPGATVFPIAEEPLVRALAGAGIAMSEDPAE